MNSIVFLNTLRVPDDSNYESHLQIIAHFCLLPHPMSQEFPHGRSLLLILLDMDSKITIAQTLQQAHKSTVHVGAK